MRSLHGDHAEAKEFTHDLRVQTPGQLNTPLTCQLMRDSAARRRPLPGGLIAPPQQQGQVHMACPMADPRNMVNDEVARNISMRADSVIRREFTAP